jgi:hypothetical protein
MAARLVQECWPEVIEAGLEIVSPSVDRIADQGWQATQDRSGRMAGGVRIDHLDALGEAHGG